jgi:hypothetical protein
MHKMYKKIILCTFISAMMLSSCVMPSSCARNRNEYDIVLPLTPPLTRSAIGYGVISASYIHILESRGESTSLGILRKGTIVKILERRPLVKSGVREMWLLASAPTGTEGEDYSGWLRETELRIYESLAQAQTAAGRLLQ